MSSTVLVFTILMLLSAKVLTDLYFGTEYVCPTCGARDAEDHGDECPWKR